MPTINNATVATGTGLSVSGNGGRKLVRLNTGWLASVAKITNGYALYKSSDNGLTWSTITTVTATPIQDATLVSTGTRVYLLLTNINTNAVQSFEVDITTNAFKSTGNIDTGQSSMGNISSAINDAGTELHAAWSSKNSTYPNSFNIRYAKGTIAADGSVTWGAAEQVTAGTSTGQFLQNPSIIFDKNGLPTIVYELNNNGTYRIIIVNKQFTEDGASFHNPPWRGRLVFLGTSYNQSNPSTIFVPQSINGLANGRVWVAWQGKDATDSAKFNIRTSYSDDGGVTWATPTKQTTGNLYDQTNASLTADAQGKVLLTWDAQNATTTQTALKVFNGTWGATTTLTGDGYTNASTLFDNAFKLSMTTPPLIRQSTSGVYFSGTYFTGASVSPASGALGNKETPSVLSYTVTPESGSTVTSIVEKVNGTTVNTYSNPASLSRTLTIPPANWDTLKYYNTHTISVTVTDSNGMANTQVYSFNKALANDASLLEGAKAAKDGKDRISTKRDGIAGQVGLPPGSTFDAISAQLASGQAFKKFASGTLITSNSSVTVNGIGFKPSFIIVYNEVGASASRMGVWIDPTLVPNGGTKYIAHVPLESPASTVTTLNSAVTTSESGFTFNFGVNNTSVKWFAFG